MTEHVLRRKWLPASEEELLDAHRAGLLEERSWCDLKRTVHFTKGGSAELARDLASFSVDGGHLIIGLDEQDQDGSPLAPVDLAEVKPERIEQIASMKVDPPLTVECMVIKAEADEKRGYVLVYVPASPLAPHQVDGKYLGRGDKTKRYLSDAEVSRLMERRDRLSNSLEPELAAFVTASPLAGHYALPHIYLVARPITTDSELCRSLCEDRQYMDSFKQIQNAAMQRAGARHVLQQANASGGYQSILASFDAYSRTPDGLRAAMVHEPDLRDAQYQSDFLEIHEDGSLRFFSGRLGSPGGNQVQAGRTFRGFFLDRTRLIVREFLALADEVSERYGFAGVWQLGVTVTNLIDVRAESSLYQTIEPYFGSKYTRPRYTGLTAATRAELGDHPGRVTDRLVGRLHRSFVSGDPVEFADPTPEAT